MTAFAESRRAEAKPAPACPHPDCVLPAMVRALTAACVTAINRVDDPAGNIAGASLEIVTPDNRVITSLNVTIRHEPPRADGRTTGCRRDPGADRLAECAARATARRGPRATDKPFLVTSGVWRALVAISGHISDADLAGGGVRILWSKKQ